MSELINELLTDVFVEQPLSLPGYANYTFFCAFFVRLGHLENWEQEVKNNIIDMKKKPCNLKHLFSETVSLD